MSTVDQTAERIKDLLTLCLAKGIDVSLKDALGHNWFEYFKQDDSKKKKEHIILRPEHHTVYDLDFQALLKLMKFHMDLRVYILSYFHPGETDIDVKYGKNSLFDNILYRLMTLYRNQIAAHKKASDVEQAISGTKNNTTYSYDDAITDMKKLAENFSTVTDGNGVSYYTMICNIANEYYNQASISYYSIREVIAVEQLGINPTEFIQICEEFRIPIASTNNEFVFATNNYNETIDLIKKQLVRIRETESSKMAGRRSLIISICVTGVLCVIVLGLILTYLLKSPSGNEPVDADSSSSYSDDDDTDSRSDKASKADEDEDGDKDNDSSSSDSAGIKSSSQNLQDEDISGDESNRYINQYNYEPEEGVLSVKPANVYYEGNTIVAKCYIINGTDHTVDSVLINDLELSVNGETICEAAFNSKAVEVDLESGEHYLQTFTFPANTIKLTDADLENLVSFCDIQEQ